MTDATEMNRAWWDSVAPVHAKSAYYDAEGFLAGASTLGHVERAALGDVAGKRILHLQCHIGLDSLSLARLGAHVVGLDFSGQSLAAARALADKAGLADKVSFVEADVMAAGEVAGGAYDIVFTSNGTYMWLADLTRWAATIAKNLAPDGFFYFLDFHPVLGMLDGLDAHGAPRIAWPYFHEGALVNEAGFADYADPSHITQGATSECIWTLADIFGALEGAGLAVRDMREYPFCSDARLPDMTKGEDGYYHRPEGALPVPMLLAFKAVWVVEKTPRGPKSVRFLRETRQFAR
jgi:SAM-dependent methyltransferase